MTQTKIQQSYHVILLAAGAGARFGGERPKQYQRILGKTLLRHTLDNVLTWPGLSSVQVVIDPVHEDLYRDAIKGLDLPEPLHGGNKRKDSINNALNNISNLSFQDIILVHDAARPFTRADDVMSLMEEMQNTRAATLATPVSDTLHRQEDAQIVDRDGLWALQTPQAFYFEDLKKAHDQANDNIKYTDDTSLMSAIGIDIVLVESARSNIKITTPDDLELAQALLLKDSETRTGFGYDVHAFEVENTDRKLTLCGIEINHDYALAGHSDADVGLHALTDALLGTIGAGDIGAHFPPSNPAYKGMDSAIFLEKAVQMVTDQGGLIQNLDLTLICEEPKIGPYREPMVRKIAEICSIDHSRVSVKATTTEGLGFTGRKEGIAAQAVATIKIRLSDVS